MPDEMVFKVDDQAKQLIFLIDGGIKAYLSMKNQHGFEYITKLKKLD